MESFLSGLELKRTVFRSDHASNWLILKGTLGTDKERVITSYSIHYTKLYEFENAVGEADDHQILDGLFPQIMVDSENLRFIKNTSRHRIDVLSRGKVTPDRLLYDNSGIRFGSTDG